MSGLKCSRGCLLEKARDPAVGDMADRRSKNPVLAGQVALQKVLGNFPKKDGAESPRDHERLILQAYAVSSIRPITWDCTEVGAPASSFIQTLSIRLVAALRSRSTMRSFSLTTWSATALAVSAIPAAFRRKRPGISDSHAPCAGSAGGGSLSSACSLTSSGASTAVGAGPGNSILAWVRPWEIGPSFSWIAASSRAADERKSGRSTSRADFIRASILTVASVDGTGRLEPWRRANPGQKRRALQAP